MIAKNAEQAVVDKLLNEVGKLASELRSNAPLRHQVSLNSQLDRDLGLDSLARVELIHRIEQLYALTLPEDTFAKIETVGDLLSVLSESGGQELAFDKQALESLSLAQVEVQPDAETTLLEVLQWHVKQHPERAHIELYQDHGRGQQIMFGELASHSYQVAWGLVESGVVQGARITIMLPTCAEYFFSFMGILAAGAVAVPIYPPARMSQIESYIRRHQTILKNCHAEVMLTTPEVKRHSTLLKSLVPSLRHVFCLDDFADKSDKPLGLKVSSNDIAFIQYTSGSTSEPKGVQLSHANLLANIRAMGQAIRLSSDDVFVSWLPLYHDMGLIGAWLGMFYHSARLVVMSPLAFLARPQRWLWAIHRHKATLSAAPNFAYDLCVHRVKDEDIEGLDLASWRVAFNGAEPVIPATVRGFCERYAAHGFRAEAYWPVYGLAESSVGLAFPQPGQKPHTQKIDRQRFMREGLARDAADDASALEFVACGEALPGHQMRIVDERDRELPDRRQGHLQFKGPSSTVGYFQNSEKNAELFHGDWLDTGDLAYMDQGQLYLTGRSKDIIIRAGRNIYPHEIEEAVGAVEGVRRGRVVAFGCQRDADHKEQLVILAETRASDAQQQSAIRQKILNVCTEIIDLPPDEVVLAPPNTVLKTSSGKLRRSACKELYLQGGIGKKRAALWWQLSKIALGGVSEQLRNQWRNIQALGYAVYSWMLYVGVAAVYCPMLFILPSRRLRRSLSRNTTRLLLWLTGTPLKIEGADKLNPQEKYIFVANHSSYLDVYVLVASLAMDYRFVAKAELAENKLMRAMLKRLSVEFVERSDREKSVSDAAHLSRIDESLLFFPEGTFTRKPGLAVFHMGAFLVAAKNQRPVVPITIQGTRSMLRPDTWFPRRGEVTVTIGAPIFPEAEQESWVVANTLKSKARKEILAHCHEPDMEYE